MYSNKSMSKTEIFLRECKKHGLVEHKKHYTSGGYIMTFCSACKLETKKKGRRKYKSEAVERFGGKCIVCGYCNCESALEFHHVNPFRKSCDLSKCTGKAKFDKEADKCVLLCSNHHREIEEGIINLTELLRSLIPLSTGDQRARYIDNLKDSVVNDMRLSRIDLDERISHRQTVKTVKPQRDLQVVPLPEAKELGEYYAKNKEKMYIYNREYRKNNKEKIKAHAIKTKEKNKAKLLENNPSD